MQRVVCVEDGLSADKLSTHFMFLRLAFDFWVMAAGQHKVLSVKNLVCNLAGEGSFLDRTR